MHGTSSLPLCNCHLSPVEGSVSGTSMKRQGCRGSQTLQRMGENSVPMGDVHNNSKGIKLSLLRQKMSILYLSQKKKISLIWSSFLEGCRTPPCLLHLTSFLWTPNAQIHYLDNAVHHCNSMSQTCDFCDHNKSRLPSIGMELPVQNCDFRRILALNLVALCFGSCQTCTYTKTSGLFYGLILMGLSVFQDPANKTDQKLSRRGFTQSSFLILYIPARNRLSSVSEPSPILSKWRLQCSVPD